MSAPTRLLVGALAVAPRSIVRPFARRYVAGSTFADAVKVVSELAAREQLATLDVLGEEIRSAQDVRDVVAEYMSALASMEERAPGATLSIRMTAMGLRVDRGMCEDNVRMLAAEASSRGRLLTIDMEDSSTTDATLATYRQLRELGHDDIGIVLQAYLHRVFEDAEALLSLRPRVRVVKGVWVEPDSVAAHDYEVIRSRYVELVDRLLGQGCYVEIATHDERLVESTLRLIEHHGVAPSDYEFQMLLGVREELGERLVSGGHRLRIYVPYGHYWYEYCLRRLKENPQLARHVARDSVSRLVQPRSTLRRNG